jgi:hypothetical protein
MTQNIVITLTVIASKLGITKRDYLTIACRTLRNICQARDSTQNDGRETYP